MNECNKKFLEKNGISIEDVCSLVDCHIYSSMEQNPIIASYGFHTKIRNEMISIADIIGYDTQYREINKNIFLSMDYFFDDKKKGYSSRSLGMLDYNKENILQNLKQSFINEPISLIETGEGKYTVFYNGLHRYTLLRILYLSEAAKAKGNEEKLAQLAKKYTIPADVTGVDLDKTYCKYLLTKAKCGDEDWDIIDIVTQYDSKYRETGNCIIKYGSGEKEVLTNVQLLALTRERVAEDLNFKANNPQIQQAYNKYLSFQMFMDEKFSDIIQLDKQKSEEKGIN